MGVYILILNYALASNLSEIYVGSTCPSFDNRMYLQHLGLQFRKHTKTQPKLYRKWDKATVRAKLLLRPAHDWL